MAKLVEGLGGRIRYSGQVTGLMLGEVGELWDAVALAEYPSLAAFQAMATSPKYQAIEHHRIAGLAGQLDIRTKPERDSRPAHAVACRHPATIGIRARARPRYGFTRHFAASC